MIDDAPRRVATIESDPFCYLNRRYATGIDAHCLVPALKGRAKLNGPLRGPGDGGAIAPELIH